MFEKIMLRTVKSLSLEENVLDHDTQHRHSGNAGNHSHNEHISTSL